MKDISLLVNTLYRNKLVRPIIKSLIPKKVRNAFLSYINDSKKYKSVSLYFNNGIARIDHKNKNIQGLVPMYYFDDTPNFGDVVGPYLVSKITGKPVLNINDSRYPGIMAVGSIMQMINRKDMVVWGSGLMYKPTNEKMKELKEYNPEILSVRGRKTANLLLEAGINVPDPSVYGDPALILPFFYKPSVSGSKEIGICPHYSHKSHFLKNITDKNNLKIIDVQKDMETVVGSISSSSVCISTSLHGLIIAQAYNIPWVWLEIFDNNLAGDDFKFKDFFSTLDESQVSHVRARLEDVKSLDYKTIAKNATLPDKLYNEELILESLKAYLDRETSASVCSSINK
ncbi:polysaccharide pyruvyl transferase family protein [Psychrobacter sp. 72-O-c]|uniref:polysaccharide pyruvyl transferase family protein n=1 Tax=Psychrobacter sp. 72-O-c TaxID=2774125 RepID=UPI0019191B69|nr:polysaccharide pyruvyl transferase family protein [Psychrobacter sp. 72-O-c]